jgi:hypothetical protein
MVEARQGGSELISLTTNPDVSELDRRTDRVFFNLLGAVMVVDNRPVVALHKN